MLPRVTARASLLVMALMLWAGGVRAELLLHDPQQSAELQLIEAQRAAFRQALGHAERGRWDLVEPHLPLLESYILYPELRGAWLRATLPRRSRAELEAFIDAYEDHPAAREVMVRWLSVLASREDWAGYDRLYTRMGGSSGARLQCLAARAELAVGARPDWQTRALALWHVGVSQPTECDPVFARLRATGALDVSHVRARLDLALEARQFGLATYLARSLAPGDRERVARWQAMQRDPARALREYPRNAADADEWPRVRYGLLMLASRDADQAFALWRELSRIYDAADVREVGRRVAVAGARRNTPQAAASLDLLPTPVIDEDVRYWQLRLALREDDWEAALRASAAPEAGNSTALQFWRARALEELAQPEQALQAYRQVAPERNLYGFMAAERSGQARNLRHRATPADALLQHTLETRADFLHARELFKVGQDSRGRSAWARATAELDEAALQQAALLAHSWGWHSRAIATAARAGLMDDLEVRYPLAWQERFSEMADLSRIPSTWAIGVARNESLFVPDIASSAGAIGLMQLLPSTGREVALQLNMPFQGLATLIDPVSNIRLGTRYLENMLARFDNHYVVATAAYNAGPGRVQRWLPSGPRAADVWIETIPFDETRDYVHRVLASQVIFHWRLTGEDLVLRDIMPYVPGRPGT